MLDIGYTDDDVTEAVEAFTKKFGREPEEEDADAISDYILHHAMGRLRRDGIAPMRRATMVAATERLERERGEG